MATLGVEIIENIPEISPLKLLAEFKFLSIFSSSNEAAELAIRVKSN